MSEQVVVRGTGTVEAQPDAARLRIDARARAKDSAGAYSAVAAIATEVDALLDVNTAAIRRRSTSGLLVSPAYEWTDKGQRSVGWDGVRTTTVEITDPGAIGAIFAGVAAAGAVAGGLEWVLDPGNAAHTEARTAAAVDARARAEAYAAALAVALGPILEIREPATYPPGGGGPAQFETRALKAQAMAGDAVAVESPDLQVVAEVDVTFALL